jgi:shikimate kinase/3-dehydroquinate synthase
MKTLVLSGFMATGKSTLGPVVAARLGLPFLDTDSELARRTGESVPNLWRGRGEATFRALEAELVRELLDDGVVRVLSFGGGTVTVRALRHFALDRAFVVTLVASPEVVLSRIHDLADRPTLAGPDPLGRVRSLLEQRAVAYAECHLRIITDELTLEEAASRIAHEAHQARVVVPLGERTYSVHFTHDAPLDLADVVRAQHPSSVLVVTDEKVRAARGEALEQSLEALAVPRSTVTLPSGEENKTLQSVQAIWDAALFAQADRRSVVVGFGGGVVGDLAGFAAATLLRGVRVLQVPTTLLAMVDASVGGKTGFDLPSGKNLIGSFHQPAAVVVDLAHLETLPKRERTAGLAEVAKIALTNDEALWLALERDAEKLADGGGAALSPVIQRAVELKAQVVRDDEQEGGLRMLLNLGHTVGHALETAGGYVRYRHGEAVALGLVLETLASERLGVAPPGVSDRVRALLRRLGLPVDLAAGELATAWPLVALDKKRVRSTVSLPLVRGVGDAVVQPVSLRDLGRALGLNEAR